MQNYSNSFEILLVSNDVALIDFLCLNLRSEGYTVVVLPEIELVSEDLLAKSQLIILDNDTPAKNLSLINKIKQDPVKANIGIIFCSEFEDERSLVEALDSGADDCIRRPFSLRELFARIRAILRRRAMVKSKAISEIIQYKEINVDVMRRAVYLGNNQISLSNIEFAILELLLQRRGTYTSRSEIFAKLWDSTAENANERVVDTNISRLRHKLGPFGAYILNRTGQGYMLAD